jgi:quercetin dioxygenase-like cupin family protein
VLLLHDAASLSGTQRWLEFAGERFSIRISAAESGGICSIVEGELGPMSGPPLHIHQNEDELIQVLEGRLRLVLNGKAFDAAAGACVPIPRGTPHSWRSLTDRPVRVVASLPGGAEVSSPAPLNYRRKASSRLRRTLA